MNNIPLTELKSCFDDDELIRTNCYYNRISGEIYCNKCDEELRCSSPPLTQEHQDIRLHILSKCEDVIKKAKFYRQKRRCKTKK